MEFSELDIYNEKKIAQFNKKGIYSVEDLLRTYPRGYLDYRNPVNMRNVANKRKYAMICVIMDVISTPSYIEAVCREEETRLQVSVKWFRQDYKYAEISSMYGMEVIVCGTYIENDYGKGFINPTVFSTDIEEYKKIFSVYSKIAGMSEAYYTDTLLKALEVYDEPEQFSDEIRDKFCIITEKEMLRKVHFPKTEQDIVEARRRIIFEDLYKFAKQMVFDGIKNQRSSEFKPIYLTNCNKLIKALPYELTEDQKNVVSSFVYKAKEGTRVNALVQGDVGSGKTICAFLLMLSMTDNGYQSVLMAPTGVLAKQHYNELKSYVEPFGLNCVYLSGELKAKEKKEVLSKIKSGEADLIIGTHSVISDSVEFKNLGLTIVDEEHKFGVIQRENLRKKADAGVHCVTMSATPIPRTLAMSLYGNAVDIYTINSMPSGRKPVKTCVSNNDTAIFNFMKNQINAGHQCYVVCSLIDNDKDDEDMEKPISVDEISQKLDDYFYGSNIKVGVITGKMKEQEKNEIISKFEANEYQILVATTIIEVGVNVPNATVITIMDADRFGLAGLHQLRGRVGRSNLQSYCILKSRDNNNDRLKAMCDTTNGFEIAERDLQLRGTGDFIGTKQSGDNHNVELMLKYPNFYNAIKEYVEEVELKGDNLVFS